MAVGKTLVLNDEGLPDDINKMAGWGVIGSRPATGDVLAGSFYYDTTNSILYQEQNGSWVAILEIKTLNAANETVPAGYYAATTLSAVDASLAAVNILSGVNIFGFVGVATVQDIADADLVIADAPTGKKFYAVTGGVKTGTGTKTLDPANETVAAGYYAATTLSTVDTDLAVGNIKKSVTIFGKVGTVTPIPDGVAALVANDTEQSTGSTSFIVLKEIKLDTPFKGSIEISFEMKNVNGLRDVYAQLRRNGVNIGTLRTENSPAYQSFSEVFNSVDWVANDLIQLYARGQADNGIQVRRLRWLFSFATTNQDP